MKALLPRRLADQAASSSVDAWQSISGEPIAHCVGNGLEAKGVSTMRQEYLSPETGRLINTSGRHPSVLISSSTTATILWRLKVVVGGYRRDRRATRLPANSTCWEEEIAPARLFLSNKTPAAGVPAAYRRNVGAPDGVFSVKCCPYVSKCT